MTCTRGTDSLSWILILPVLLGPCVEQPQRSEVRHVSSAALEGDRVRGLVTASSWEHPPASCRGLAMAGHPTPRLRLPE